MLRNEESLLRNTVTIYKSDNPIAAFCNAAQVCDARNVDMNPDSYRDKRP